MSSGNSHDEHAAASTPWGVEVVRYWYEHIREAERHEAREYGFVIPGDSSLAVVLNAMEEAAYAGDPKFDSRVRVEPTYPATPVDCLISELRDNFYGRNTLFLTRDAFEKRVAQFKREAAC